MKGRLDALRYIKAQARQQGRRSLIQLEFDFDQGLMGRLVAYLRYGVKENVN